MPDLSDLAGSYKGRYCVRPGKEDQIAPAERKKLLKQSDPASLIIRADGTFTYKGGTEGRIDRKGATLTCRPTSVSGATLEQMEQAAREAGRTFGLAWLFRPFELRIEGEVLICAEADSVIHTEFRRDG